MEGYEGNRERERERERERKKIAALELSTERAPSLAPRDSPQNALDVEQTRSP